MVTPADIESFKKDLLKLEREVVEAIDSKNWKSIESADDKIQATIGFWVDSIKDPGMLAERQDAQEFLSLLMSRYKNYLDKIVDLKSDASEELKKLQSKKQAINQYLGNI